MVVYTYVGSAQPYVVPLNATVLAFKVYGAGYDDPSKGGEGGVSEGRLAVTGGDTLWIRCGGVGVNGAGGGGAGGFNGGGNSFGGFSGCGASDVRQGGTALSNRKIVAGGGGGTGQTGSSPGRFGGDGGGATGADSQFSDAGGGSQTQGGLNSYGSRAVNDRGGDGLSDSLQVGGGGGGGYHGGGGGDGIKGGGGGSGYVGGVTSGTTSQGGWQGPGRVEIIVVETSPNKPTWATPAADTVFDRTADFSIGYLFSDDTPGDSQSARDIRYKAAGAGSWDATIHDATDDTDYTIPGGTFSAGRKEIQVLVYDQVNNASPWSDSLFLKASDPTEAPVFTSPSEGDHVDTPLPATWTADDQDAYRLRRVDDIGGDADPTTVYWLGPIVTSATGAGVFTFDVNNRDEHLQVQVLAGDLWSLWADVGVTVEFAPTSVPVVELEEVYEFNVIAAIDVSWTNPAAAGDEVEAVSNEVWVKDYDVWERFATGQPLNSSWRYPRPRSGIDYSTRIKVVAVGTNGGTAEGFPT